MSKRHIPKTCVICGQSFMAHSKEVQCCSRACGSKIGGAKTAVLYAAKAAGEARCTMCGQTLTNIHDNLTLYCSTACRDAHKRRERMERIAQSNNLGGWSSMPCPWSTGAVHGTAAGADFCLGF